MGRRDNGEGRIRRRGGSNGRRRSTLRSFVSLRWGSIIARRDNGGGLPYWYPFWISRYWPFLFAKVNECAVRLLEGKKLCLSISEHITHTYECRATAAPHPKIEIFNTKGVSFVATYYAFPISYCQGGWHFAPVTRLSLIHITEPTRRTPIY